MEIHLLKYSTHCPGKTSQFLLKAFRLLELKIRRLGKGTYFLGMPAHLLKMRILVRKRFRTKDVEFYNQYRAIRAVKDVGIRHKKTDEQPAEPAAAK
jgi:hypothetical protein